MKSHWIFRLKKDMAHNIINIDGSKEREKAIVGSKGSKKYQPWQLSIKYKKKKNAKH